MEAALFTKMLSDKKLTDLKKLGYKYPQARHSGVHWVAEKRIL